MVSAFTHLVLCDLLQFSELKITDLISDLCPQSLTISLHHGYRNYILPSSPSTLTLSVEQQIFFLSSSLFSKNCLILTYSSLHISWINWKVVGKSQHIHSPIAEDWLLVAIFLLFCCCKKNIIFLPLNASRIIQPHQSNISCSTKGSQASAMEKMRRKGIGNWTIESWE